MIGKDIEHLIKMLARLPGLGPRSARRAALYLLKNRETLMLPLSQGLARATDVITTCGQCNNLDTTDPCSICANAAASALSPEPAIVQTAVRIASSARVIALYVARSLLNVSIVPTPCDACTHQQAIRRLGLDGRTPVSALIPVRAMHQLVQFATRCSCANRLSILPDRERRFFG